MKVTKENIVVDGKIQEVVDGYGPVMTYLTILPHEDSKHIDLVFGAARADRCASLLNKASLKELIQVLRKVHRAMQE